MTPIVSSFIRAHIKHITYGPRSTYSSHYSNLVFMIPDGLVSVKYWMIRPPNVSALLVTWNTRDEQSRHALALMELTV